MMRMAMYSDDRELHALLSSAFGEKFEVHPECKQDDISRLITTENCDLVYLDLNSAHCSLSDRVAFCRQIIASPASAVILADDYLLSTAIELLHQGAEGYLHRSSFIRDMRNMMHRRTERSLQKPHYISESRTSKKCGEMIGNSLPMQRVYDLVYRVADLDASVLITGESGTGKELIARSIHSVGNRSGRPFVAVSCSAIPDTLLEAELFGHEKGAFTGTVGAREGYLEQAACGTLFLDEIGDLSLQAQVKLLRVLQEREFCRLGSTRLIPLQARMVFATHRKLKEMVEQGTFREDLYYRINVVTLNSPPLRDRPEDIADIAMHFIQRYSEAYHKPIECIEPDALNLLRDYSWPGNVRELENTIQRAIVFASGTSVGTKDLPLNLQEETAFYPDANEPPDSFERRIRLYKIKLASEALRESNGNKTMAARSLSISRAYLHRLLRFGEPDQFIDEESPRMEAV